jgi:hypothetical protein
MTYEEATTIAQQLSQTYTTYAVTVVSTTSTTRNHYEWSLIVQDNVTQAAYVVRSQEDLRRGLLLCPPRLAQPMLSLSQAFG